VDVIENEEDELVEITKSDWYRDIRRHISPGENMRIYRELHGLSQENLGRKLGRFTRQNVSSMERGHRAISKPVAKKLAEVFDVSVEKFL
jgi:plasmid maintenance system antidote protein VapI